MDKTVFETPIVLMSNQWRITILMAEMVSFFSVVLCRKERSFLAWAKWSNWSTKRYQRESYSGWGQYPALTKWAHGFSWIGCNSDAEVSTVGDDACRAPKRKPLDIHLIACLFLSGATKTIMNFRVMCLRYLEVYEYSFFFLKKKKKNVDGAH